MLKKLFNYVLAILIFCLMPGLNVSAKENEQQNVKKDEKVTSQEIFGKVYNIDYGEDESVKSIKTTLDDGKVIEFTFGEILGSDVVYFQFENDSNKEIALIFNKEKVSYDYDLNAKVGSPWIFTREEKARGFTVSWNIIDAGMSALNSAIVSTIMSWSPSGVVIGSVSGIATYIMNAVEKGHSYTTNVSIKHYYYGGCTWLLGTEFVFPAAHSAFQYSWTDNPVLGVAPQPCKIASLTYPYR